MTDAIEHSLKLYPVLYNLFSLWEPHQRLQPTTKTTAQKENVSVQGIAAQFIYNAICGDLGDHKLQFSGNCALDEDELT